MAFLTIVLFGIIMTIFKNIQAENNEISMPKNVNLSESYEVNIPPSGSSLTWVSYEITRFLIEKVNELEKHITVHIKMRGSWADSRINANFTGSHNDAIVILYNGKQSHPPIWNPFSFLYIPESTSRTNTYDSTKIKHVKIYRSQLYSFGRFPPNTTLISSSIDERIIITCVDDVTYSYFPHDIHNCKLRMKSYYVNATMDVNIKKGNEKFSRSHNLAGFKITNSIIPETKIKRSSSSGIEYTEFGVAMKFERRFGDYAYKYFLPCILIVTASTLSFIIPLSALPGRVALVVTLFLTLTNNVFYARVNLRNISFSSLYNIFFHNWLTLE